MPTLKARRDEALGGPPGQVRVELASVTKRFLSPTGTVFTAISDVTMSVGAGQFCAVVGPTGCGKSTMLSMVSGLDRPSGGAIRVNGAPVRGIVDGVGFMFQADALLPWKSVLHNVSLGPTFHRMDKRQAKDLARDWIRRVGLSGFEDHYPHQLSGGMRKRAAMAAALINEPSILLMDEPFGALDVQTKAIMSDELLTLWDQSRPSVLFITHDLEEAIYLADQVVVMTASPGRIKAVYEIDLPRPRGTAQQLRFHPRFVELQRRIWESLRDEVQRAYQRSATGTPVTAAEGREL